MKARLSVVSILLAVTGFQDALAQTDQLNLTLRSRVKTAVGDTVVSNKAAWASQKTAFVICDMWDDHWCRSAARRVGELAGPMNEVIAEGRRQGVFIIHAPSSVVDFYSDTPQRKRAQHSPMAKTPIPLSTADRWGTKWCWPDPSVEGELPIDDSDMGCSCQVKCEIRDAWSRQIATLAIHEEDAVTDSGQETYNLLEERGIDNVVLLGVHLNMCVLGRPFGIRQMKKIGKNVALMRDMTDTMYNPDRAPKVSHFEGTDLVIEHVERYWCPSFVSSDITGKAAFRFKGDRR